ncbi:hypothetical protein PG994_007158 [Apiospora phragmitis]|uniref:Uncharacterized protein n=1 Tax=Apiospora phragmitis TaxID=2905665 RepID=A0ABR1V2M5_9PEZI
MGAPEVLQPVEPAPYGLVPPLPPPPLPQRRARELGQPPVPRPDDYHLRLDDIFEAHRELVRGSAVRGIVESMPDLPNIIWSPSTFINSLMTIRNEMSEYYGSICREHTPAVESTTPEPFPRVAPDTGRQRGRISTV